MPLHPATPAAAAAMNQFAIRLEAAATTCPIMGTPLSALHEEFTVEAADRVAALKAARVKMTIRPMGQQVRFYIDGTEQRG